jgi:hypothetical protein
LLDDLLFAEDLAASETTSAANHAAAVAAATNVQRESGRYAYSDEQSGQTAAETTTDGAVVLGTPVAPPVNGDMYSDISPENAIIQGQRFVSIISQSCTDCMFAMHWGEYSNLFFHRRLSKGVDYLVEASAAEAEAISATLAAVKARQVNGEMEHSPDRAHSPDATPSGKQNSSLIKPDLALSNNSTPTGVRLHHRAVSWNCN